MFTHVISVTAYEQSILQRDATVANSNYSHTSRAPHKPPMRKGQGGGATPVHARRYMRPAAQKKESARCHYPAATSGCCAQTRTRIVRSASARSTLGSPRRSVEHFSLPISKVLTIQNRWLPWQCHKRGPPSYRPPQIHMANWRLGSSLALSGMTSSSTVWYWHSMLDGM